MPSKYTPRPEIDPATVLQTPTTDGRVAFWVASRSGKNICYLVEQRGATLFCSCPARKPCCHIRAVEARIALDAQAAEAERLASLPRTLANVEQSEESKLSEADEPEKHCTYCGKDAWSCDCPCPNHVADEPQPDIVALLAEPDLPASALYFEDDEPRQPVSYEAQRRHSAEICAALRAALPVELERAQRERDRKRAEALPVDAGEFSIWKS